MVQILPRNDQESTSDMFGESVGNMLRGFGQSITAGDQNRQQQKLINQENMAIKQQFGVDLSGINDPEARKQMVINALQGKRDLQQQGFETQQQELKDQNSLQNQSALSLQKHEQDLIEKGMDLSGKTAETKRKQSTENKEKLAPFEGGLKTIADMRALGKKGNLGKTWTRGFFGGEEAKDRGQYEQLGKSLISLASNIPIRNQKEFETLAHNLYDPSVMDSEREGILDAMESIIKRNMAPFEEGELSESIGPGQEGDELEDPEGNKYHWSGSEWVKK